MFNFVVFALIASVVLATTKPLVPKTEEARPFEGEQVVKCLVETKAKREFIKQLEDHHNLDVWKEYMDGHSDIRVSPSQLMMLYVFGIECEVLIENLGQVIADASDRRKKYTHNREVYFTEYHTYPEQVAWYNDMCSTTSYCTRVNIGQSYLGNTQYEYRLFQNATNPVIFLDAGIHAREWISSATLQFVFNNLISTATTPNSLVSRYNWIIHGHQNPDGYIFSWSSDANRLWRKSRNVNQGSACIGTDLNRNWPTPTWGGGGSSPNPCSDTYHGSGPASEPEVQNLLNRFTSAVNSYTIPGAISFHSYSQLILRPWGHTTTDSPDEDELFDLGEDMQTAIRNTHGLNYDNIKSIELYVTTGTTSDWYYYSSRPTPWGTKTFSYTFELRDTGRFGFELPEEQIIPQGEEIWNAIVAFANYFG